MNPEQDNKIESTEESVVLDSSKFFPDLKIVVAPNPVLNKVSEEVKEFGPALKELVNAMKFVMKKLDGVGLSAIQVNVPIKIFVLDESISDLTGGHTVFVNPKVNLADGAKVVSIKEGCLSFPGLVVQTLRADKVTVDALDENGNPFSIIATDIGAVACVHENDHLQGLTFIDKLSKLKKDMYKSKYAKLIKARDNK